jgi:hypothetical protein
MRKVTEVFQRNWDLMENQHFKRSAAIWLVELKKKFKSFSDWLFILAFLSRCVLFRDNVHYAD